MKGKIKWTALLLVLALVVAACGNGDSEADTTTADTAGEETTTTEGDAPATTESDGGEEMEIQTIPVGAVYSLTGPFADFSVIYQEGINLVLDDVNAELAAVGYELEMVYEDSQADPTLGLQSLHQAGDRRRGIRFAHRRRQPRGPGIAADCGRERRPSSPDGREQPEARWG